MTGEEKMRKSALWEQVGGVRKIIKKSFRFFILHYYFLFFKLPQFS